MTDKEFNIDDHVNEDGTLVDCPFIYAKKNKSDRTRQLTFIRSFGNGRILDEAALLVVEMGDDFFTDDQVKMICDRVVEKERESQHRMIENRKILKGE